MRQLLDDAGIHVVQTPFQAPNANAYAERFVRSIKHECLNRVIPLGERHFRRTISEFVEHYHRERNHQGLGNTLIDGIVPDSTSGSDSSPFTTRWSPELLRAGRVMWTSVDVNRLGGVMGHYGHPTGNQGTRSAVYHCSSSSGTGLI